MALLLTAVAAATAGCGAASGHEDAAATPAAPGFGTVLDAPVPQTILDAPLVDQNGHHVTLGQWRGKIIVLSDVMTLCQETCPLVTASMLAAARQVDRTRVGKDVEFVSLTIDPQRDDLRHLRAYRHQFGALANWTALRGSPTVVNSLWSRLGVWRHQIRLHPPYPTDWLTGRPLTTDIAHTDELVFINGAQHYRYEMEGPGSVKPQRIPQRIFHFMDGLGHRNAQAPDSGAWTPAQVTKALDWMLGGGSQ
ncbi:MAG: SCO family protein [Nocardioides sp.]|nr:SCO family protein [Nocardioides sp.]